MGRRLSAWLRGFARIGEGWSSIADSWTTSSIAPPPQRSAEEMIAESWRRVGQDLERAMRDIDEATDEVMRKRRG